LIRTLNSSIDFVPQILRVDVMSALNRSSIHLCWLLGFWLLMFCSLVHAQEQVGPCPAGMSQYPGANGIPSCGPLIKQPMAMWEHRWGAITWDKSRGVMGASFNQPSKAAAEQAAIADCQSPSAGGGEGCQVDITYHDQCVALIISTGGHYEGSSATIDQAVKIGMNTCIKYGDTRCRAAYTSCSLPVRVQ
jgi:hypothetical protein